MVCAMSDLRVLLVTATAEEAPRLVRALCEERLIACGNLVQSVRSIYRWEGQICDTAEVLIVMETMANRLDAAQSRIQELHSYDVPKIIALAPADVAQAYEAWVATTTRE